MSIWFFLSVIHVFSSQISKKTRNEACVCKPRFFVFKLFYKCTERFVCGIEIRFRDKFVRCVHGKYGYAHIHGVDVHFGDVLRNRSAAAEVNSSELARLPYNVLFRTRLSNMRYIRRMRRSNRSCLLLR